MRLHRPSVARREQNWEWRDDWHVDFPKEVGTQLDSAGWEYAGDFDDFSRDKLRARRYGSLLQSG